MYWTDYRNDVIERANMDTGDDRQVLISGGVEYPHGLAIDFNSTFIIIIIVVVVVVGVVVVVAVVAAETAGSASVEAKHTTLF